MRGYVVMDVAEATLIVATHVQRGGDNPRDRRGEACAICRVYVERDHYTVVPLWPCPPLRTARDVLGAARRREVAAGPPPPPIPTGIPTPRSWGPGTETRRRVPPKVRNDVADCVSFEPSRRETWEVEVTVHVDGDCHVFTVSADEARLAGLQAIRAADASERRGWTG